MRRKMSLSAAQRLYGKPKLEKAKINFDLEKYKEHLHGIGQQLAQEFLEVLKNNILTNKYGFSNTPRTVELKGGNSVPWVHTGELLDALVVSDTVVGFMFGKHSGSNILYEDLAMLLEMGMLERGIPPKDVMQRTMEDFRPYAIDFIIKAHNG